MTRINLNVLICKLLKAQIILLFFSLPSNADSATQLSPQDVVNILFHKSLKKEDLITNYRIAEALESQASGVYDPYATVDLGYTLDAMESLNGLSNEEDRTLILALKLGKVFSSGTNFSFTFQRTHQDSLLGSFSQNLRPPVQFQNTLRLELEQPLWNNAWGVNTQRQVQRAKFELKKAKMDQLEEIENLALTSLRLYWDTYVAKESLNSARSAREKYKYLGEIVRRKQRVNLISPGEYNQVLAESAVQEQLVKEASAEYLRLSEVLYATLYDEDKNFDDIEFVIKDLIPPLPKVEALNIASLRAHRKNEVASEISQSELAEARNASRPILNLVARTQISGVEQQESEAVSDMLSGAHPEYYIGLNLQTTLSGVQSQGKVEEKELRRLLAQSQIRQSALELGRQERHLARLAQATHQVAEIASETYVYRKKAVDEQERGFIQGRFALSQLTRSFVDLFQAETRKIRAVGNYHMALHEWAASRDELFRGETNEKNE
jgi:outer membrane protein TolC